MAGSAKQNSRRLEVRPRLRAVCVGIATLLTLLCAIKFDPVLPASGLDLSWFYGMDFGSAHHLPFGRALVFTYGPLVSLYTDLRVPEHETLYLASSGALAWGLVAGVLLATAEQRRAWLLLLPLILANAIMKDATLFAVPFTLVMAAARGQPETLPGRLMFGSVAVADGILLLVKATCVIPIVGCTALACLVLLRSRSRWAFILPGVTVGTALGAWVVTGQSLSNLPAYLSGAFELSAGYTDAMSLVDGFRRPLVFVVLVGMCCIVLLGTGLQHRVPILFALLGVSFLTFKAAFVRQDGHALIAASWLALIGFLLFLCDTRRRAYISLLLGAVGWYALASSYVTTDTSIIARPFEAIRSSLSALGTRLDQSDAMAMRFAEAKAALRNDVPMLQLAGTTDIYPVEIASVLAWNLDWNPRPVLQSYSAYTTRLATMNARHLEQDKAPDNILFEVAPIDNRFPSLEDGASWPALLADYEFRTFVGRYALLKRTNADHRASFGEPSLNGSFPFDADIAIPPGHSLNWASLAFHPSVLGRWASFLYKRPLLFLKVTYASGQQQSFRLIAGMADGFLLSPVVQSTRDFVSVSSGDPLEGKQVRSIAIHQASTHKLWGSAFDLTLTPLTFRPHAAPETPSIGARVPGKPIGEVPQGGECSFDLVDGQRPDGAIRTIEGPSVTVHGWGILKPLQQRSDGDLQVAISDDRGRTFYSDAERVVRPDVNAHFNLPPDTKAGYESRVDLRDLKGIFTVRVIQRGTQGLRACSLDHLSIMH